MMSPAISEITRRGVVPVVVAESPGIATPLAAALTNAGLPLAEVTLRTPSALEVIATMARVNGFIVGAGTVVSPAQVDAAAAAGAAFVVSPGLSEGVVSRCQDIGLAVLPGVATASEVMRALDLGLQVFKFFPAETSGGVPAVAALGGPFPDVSFVPTGGINAETAKAYLELPNVAAIGGSWFVSRALLGRGDYERITALTRDVLTLVRQTRKARA